MKHQTILFRVACFLFLMATFFCIFPESRHLFTKVYLIGDSLTYYYPLASWAKDRLMEGRLPILSDLAYHGAPIAAQSSIGLLSPVILLLLVLPLTLAFNLILFLPLIISLAGFYRLGRHYQLDRSSSLLLSLLGSLNGAADVHLSLFIVTWANAFFPWTWCFISRFVKTNRWSDVWCASLCYGLTIAIGHPQMVLMQGTVLVFWILASPEATRAKRFGAVFWTVCGGLLFSCPRWLHTFECVFYGAGASFAWNDLDTYFHSWTPFNPVTMIFPDFFGKTQLTGETNYWWLYHYNEMQFGLGIVGLCFLVLYFRRHDPHRRWILLATLFFFLMALGRFGPLYPLLHPFPPFSWFRDPARWLMPMGWILAFAAARGFQFWSQGCSLDQALSRISMWIFGISLFFLFTGRLLFSHAQGLLRTIASPFIAHFIKGDSLHPASVQDYLARLPEKLGPLSRSLDITRPEVFIPLAILLMIALAIKFLSKVPRFIPVVLFLCLALFESAYFNLRLGDRGFLNTQTLPAPTVPAPQSRSLALTPHTALPNANEVSKLAFPNTNFLSKRPSLPYFLYPSLPRYEEIGSRLGWMSWVYKDRESEGWRNHPNLLRALGVDLVIANEPLTVSPPFKALPSDYFGALSLGPVAPKAALFDRVELCPWPALLERMEEKTANPLHTAYVEILPHPLPVPGALPAPEIIRWEDLQILLRTNGNTPSFLILQKTYLCGWKATVNGRKVPLQRAQGVLCGLALPKGPCEVILQFKPTGLRFAFFFFMIFLSVGMAIGMGKFAENKKIIRR
jgi:hypothetical protein